MSVDPGSGLRALSPASSGRNSPVHRISRQLADQGIDPKDKFFRRYASAVERALTSFDVAQQEWADYISFLARLLKALQSRPAEIHVVPESYTVATRLAQCLNPDLPSGVHQKALEVYKYVFEAIGKSNLGRDIHLYLPGLASVLSFAALSVRPLYIRLIETHIVALDATALRSPLKAIILCLLPGLEDEGSEDHNQLVQLVDKFRVAVRLSTHAEKASLEEDDAQDSYFWQCFFLAIITNSSRRQGALSYLSRELPKFADVSPHGYGDNSKATYKANLSVTAKAALAPEPGLLIRCLAAGLSDSQVLVQRGFLDLLVTHLPLNSSVLQEMVPKSDLDRLMSGAISVVLRRDMSLNRRLWTWLLGPDSKDDQEAEDQGVRDLKSPGPDLLTNHAAYFGKYGLRALTRSVLAMFSSSSSSVVERAKPFRLCLSLMDRWEVGGLLVPDIFLPALQSAYAFSKVAEKSFAEDVMKSASQFFDGVESGIIWAKFNQLIGEAFKSNSNSNHIRELLDLADFIVFRFNIREEEMITRHIPHSTLFLLAHLMGMVEAMEDFESDYSLTLDIVEKLLSLIPARVFSENPVSGETDKQRSTLLSMSRVDIISRISTYYVDHHGGLDGNPPPFTTPQLGQLILRESTSLLIQLLVIKPSSSAIEPIVRVVCGLILRVPHATDITAQLRVFEGLISMLQVSEEDNTYSPVPFRALAAMIALLVTSQSILDGTAFISPINFKIVQNLAIKQIWSHLSPYNPKHHVEAVRCLWQLEAISPDRKAVEAAITTFMSQDLSMADSALRANAARRFAILWTHSTLDKSLPVEKAQKGLVRRTNSASWGLGQSVIPADASNVLSRPLLVLLDHLEEEGTEISILLRTWLQELPTVSRVFSILISKTRSLQCMKPAEIRNGSVETMSNSFVNSNDSRQCLYYMKIFLNILRNASDNIWITLAETTEQAEESSDGQPNSTLQVLLVQLSLKALDVGSRSPESHLNFIQDLHRVSIELVLLILQSPYSNPLKVLELQNILLQRLQAGIEVMDPLLHPPLLETITAALKLHINRTPPMPLSPGMPRKTSKDFISLPPKVTLLKDKTTKDGGTASIISPPSLLIDCLKSGFQSEKARVVLDSWVLFLVAVIPICTESVLQNLIPLVECFCKQITLVFNQLKVAFKPEQAIDEISPESTLITLLDALENILQSAHQRISSDEGNTNNSKSPDQPQGFFGNMVQGVFTGDTAQSSRPSVANSRLTVLLCFQDAVRTCFSIWCWGIYAESTEKQDSLAVASYAYTSLRMRNRTRRLLEHLFLAEGLECLETLASIWAAPQNSSFEPQSVLGLLNVLNGSKPKHTIPAIFNAIYSRTNPSGLDPSRQSSLTSELKDVDLVAFLVEYTKTVDDDAMDEIWNDCATFLRDVLANPLPHSQILPSLLIFIAILAEKVDNTNFGEQRKTRKELGDIFSRLLTATFTTRPMGFLLEPVHTTAKQTHSQSSTRSKKNSDVLSALQLVVPQLKLILMENDRVQNAVNSITANVTGPTLRARAFPSNIDRKFLALLYELTKIPQASKLWKKDVSDALNDSRFFMMPLDLIEEHWLSIIHEYIRNDNDRLPEFLSRIPAPTTAGIVFGVGATSARLDADRRTQMNLRRIALVIMASPTDAFAQSITSIQEKLVELLSATATSSPSSATRTDIFLLMRVIFVKVSTVHLGSIWPILTSELQSALLSVLPESDDFEKYSNLSVIQAAKLLDTLVVLDLDEFQLHEWLFITDTIDAVYRAPDTSPLALVDSLSESLAGLTVESDLPEDSTAKNAVLSSANGVELRRPILDVLLESEALDLADLKAMPKQDLAVRILKPFFGQLSLLAFEATYGMLRPDMKRCLDGIIKDVFEDSGDPDTFR